MHSTYQCMLDAECCTRPVLLVIIFCSLLLFSFKGRLQPYGDSAGSAGSERQASIRHSYTVASPVLHDSRFQQDQSECCINLAAISSDVVNTY